MVVPMSLEADLFLAFDPEHFGGVDDDFHRSEADVLDGEQNLVREILVVLLTLNHSLLGAHVREEPFIRNQCTYTRSSIVI